MKNSALIRKFADASASLKYGLKHSKGPGGKCRAVVYWFCEKSLRYLPPRIYWDLLARIDPYQTVGLTSDPQELYQQQNELVDHLLSRGLLGPQVVTLHIGAGVGRIEYAISPHVKHCYGIDVSRVITGVATRHLADFGNATFCTGDGRTLGNFADAMFDVIYSAISFQHMPRDVFKSYLNEVVRTLKPQGTLFFGIPVSAQAESITADQLDAHSMRRYTLSELRQLIAEAGGLRLETILNEELVGTASDVEVWVVAQKEIVAPA